jgi:hypothetical protein
VTDVPLFGGYERPEPASPPGEPFGKGSRDGDGLSADQRRTLRQAANVAAGVHPYTREPIHTQADRTRTRTSPPAPFTCGTCRFRYPGGDHSWPGCEHPDTPRKTHSASTDVRAWWPACKRWEPKEDTDAAGD